MTALTLLNVPRLLQLTRPTGPGADINVVNNYPGFVPLPTLPSEELKIDAADEDAGSGVNVKSGDSTHDCSYVFVLVSTQI